MENVTDAIVEAERDLAGIRDALREAKAMVAALEQDERTVVLELTGLRSYAQRRGLTAVAETSSSVVALRDADVVPISGSIAQAPAPTPSDLLAMSRNEAVATVLGRAGVPLDRNAIHEQCAFGGRDDTLDEVSLSLSGLKRSGRVEKLGQGLWRLVDSATG